MWDVNKPLCTGGGEGWGSLGAVAAAAAKKLEGSGATGALILLALFPRCGFQSLREKKKFKYCWQMIRWLLW